MAVVPSFFGELAKGQSLQALIDNSIDALEGKSIWRNWLDVGTPGAALTFEQVIGRSRIEAAASVVDPDAPAPLRSRGKLEMLTGKIPTIKEKFAMNGSQFRQLKVMESLPISNNDRVKALISALWDDVSKAAVAGDRRIDMMLLQAITTLSVDINTTNNPDGVAFGNVDLLAQSYQTQGVPVVWSNTASTPITDIEKFVGNVYNVYGRRFGRIVMPYEVWLNFKNTTEVKDMLKSYFNIGKTNGTYANTLANVNDMFAANMWPPIEILNYTTGVEKDGVITASKPYNTNNIVFMPAGKIGTLVNAFAIEDWMKDPIKQYAKFGATLVSKYMTNDPIIEYTAMEMNAFPAVDVDGIFILKTTTVGNLGIS